VKTAASRTPIKWHPLLYKQQSGNDKVQ